jgi:hypothetical protein
MLSIRDVQIMHKSRAQLPSLLCPPQMLNGLKFSKNKNKNLTITLAFHLEFFCGQSSPVFEKCP